MSLIASKTMSCIYMGKDAQTRSSVAVTNIWYTNLERNRSRVSKRIKLQEYQDPKARVIVEMLGEISQRILFSKSLVFQSGIIIYRAYVHKPQGHFGLNARYQVCCVLLRLFFWPDFMWFANQLIILCCVNRRAIIKGFVEKGVSLVFIAKAYF